MEFIFYNIISIGLFCLTTNMVRYKDTHMPVVCYAAGIVILEIAVVLIYCLTTKSDRKKLNRRALVAVAVLINCGMAVNYKSLDASEKISFGDMYISDLIPMIIGGVTTYVVVRYTNIYKNRLLNIAGMILLPLLPFIARLTGREIYGSYLYIGPFMVFAVVIFIYVFIAGYFMSQSEKSFFQGNVNRLSWEMLVFLGYNMLLFMGCVVINEFGLLFILAITASLLFFIRSKDTAAKLVYTGICVAAAGIAAACVPHIRTRIKIWLDPAANAKGIEEQAESVLYLFRHIKQIGWWGQSASLSYAIYPTRTTDHVLIYILNDYSILLALAVVLICIALVRYMFILPKQAVACDRYLSFACGLVVCLIVGINVASELGSFMTSGIGLPFVSEGSSTNMMLIMLVAIHAALLNKYDNCKSSIIYE